MTEAKIYDIFISYAEANRAWVEGYLLDALNQAGIRYHSEAAFALGRPRLLEFERAIQQSQRILLVLSPAYLADDFNQFVDILAQGYGLDTATWPVIPLILEPVLLPPRLSILVQLKATNSEEWEEAIERLCADLRRPVPTVPSKPLCPYPGMVPFSEEQSDRFFGRDEEIQDALERLRLHPFLTAIGPSGSGKSSLVFAGLIPYLRRSGLFGSGDWLILNMRPGQTPLTTLNHTLRSNIDNAAIAVIEALATQPNAQKLLLVIDQFEEVFTLAQEEAVPFQQTLQLLIQIPNCYVILTVRADFYPDLMQSPLWGNVQPHRLEIVPLNETGLRQAIIKPAEDVDVFVEPTLVERLVVDAAGEPGVLPLIQETLVLLWERVERRFLPLRAYEALVLPRSAYDMPTSHYRTGLQVAIARRADAALAGLSKEQEAIARRIFLRLIQFGEGRADTRRQQPVDDLRTASDESHLFDQILHRLADNRLLTLTGQEDSATKVDIAHEALISGWPKLQEWITQRRGAEQTRRQLEVKADEWVRLGKGVGGLLDQIELAEAKRWVDSPDAADLGYDKALPSLIKASSDRQLFNRFLWGAVTVGAVITAILTGFLYIRAEVQKREAQRQKVTALSQTAEVFWNNNQQLEALLAAVKAGKEIKNANLKLTDFPNQNQIETILQKTVYGVQEINRLEGHSYAVKSISFSRNGKIIVSGSADGSIKLWKLDSGEIVLKTAMRHNGSVNSVSFSPNSKMIVSGSADGTIKLWNAQNGREITTNSMRHSGAAINSVSFNHDSNKIVSASDEGTIKVWNLDGREEIYTIPMRHSGAVNSVSFSPNSKMIVSGGADGTIKLWDAQNGQPITTTLMRHRGAVNSVSFSLNGEMIASGGDDGILKLWSLKGELKTFCRATSRVVNSVSFSHDSKKIAFADSNGNMTICNPHGRLLQFIKGHSATIYSVSFSPDDQMIASASWDKTIRIWSLKGQEPQTLFRHGGTVWSVSFSPDDKRIASVSFDKSIKLWNQDSREIISYNKSSSHFWSASFSPKANIIASGDADGNVKLWDLKLKEIKTLGKHIGEVWSVSFSHDGKMIVSGSTDGTIKLWNLKNGQEIVTKNSMRHSSPVWSVSFNPDNTIIASGGADGTIKLWSSSNGQERNIPKKMRHDRDVHSVSFSPNGKIIASGSADSTIKLWNSQDGQLLDTLKGHNDRVNSISFNPKNETLASASWDGTIKIWRIKDGKGQQLKTLIGYRSPINSVSFSHDGKAIAAAGWGDNVIKLWNVNEQSGDVGNDLDQLLKAGCDKLDNYLKTNRNNKDNRNLCNNVP